MTSPTDRDRGLQSFASGIDGAWQSDGLLPTTIDFESLRHYTASKLAISNQLRTLLDLLKTRGDETRVQQCEELMSKLAEDRFTIAVLGQFKRGKSSLLNAIIGRDLLPTGVLPLTSVITSVRFGTRERLVIYRRGLQFPICDSIATLADYVTEQHNPANRKDIEIVVIELPLPFLRRGLEFVDTPGIASAIRANTETTYSFLPKCDAVLLVTSVDSPLSEAELELLRSVRGFVRKIFFILNKVDLLSDVEQVAQVMDFVKSRIAEAMGVSEVSVIPLSARQALEANVNKSTDQFTKSGLVHLQKTLSEFLAVERQAMFLAAIVDRATQLTSAELQATELSERANAATGAELKRFLNDFTARAATSQTERLWILEEIRERSTLYLRGSFAEALATRLAEIGDGAVRRLDRFIHRAPFSFASSFVQRYSKGVNELFWVRVSHWIRTNKEQLTNDLNVVAGPNFRKLSLKIGELEVLPHRAIGLINPQTTPIPKEFDSITLTPHFDLALLKEMRWDPALPFFVGFLPTGLIRPWLAQHLRSQLQRLVDDQELGVIRIIQKAVDDGLRTLGQQASAYAAKLERRAGEVLTKTSPAQSEHTRKTLKDESMVLYRQGLQTLNANFSALHEHVRSELKDIESVSLTSVEPLSSPASKPERDGSTKPIDKRSYTTRGCPVCNYLVGISKEFFAGFQYSLYNDEEQQRSFAEGGGFCPFHLWQLESVCSPVGFSVGVSKLLKRVARLLRPSNSTQSAKEVLQQIGPNPRQCVACISIQKYERDFVINFVMSLSDAEVRNSYAKSQGVCLRHLGMAIDVSPPQEVTVLLLKTASTGFQLMAEDMEAFALKREASRRHMVSDDEADAHLRAAVHLAGAKHNCMPWTFNDDI